MGNQVGYHVKRTNCLAQKAWAMTGIEFEIKPASQPLPAVFLCKKEAESESHFTDHWGDQTKGCSQVLDTQCAHKRCLLSVFGMACFIETAWTLSSGLFYSPLICLSVKICLKLSIFSYSIFCHWLHSFPNHTKLSSCFRRLWEIQILFYKCCTKPPPPFRSWFFQLLNHFYWPLLLTRLAKALW